MNAQKGKKVAPKPGGAKGKPAASKAAKSTAKSPEKPAAPEAEKEKEILAGIKCSLRDMDKVLVQDEGGQIKDSGRWPLLIDVNGQGATFLRYRDVNYLCTANSSDMQPDRVKRALAGAIKFGKPMVIDMLDTDMLHFVEKVMDEIQPNLFKDVMSKEILKDERYEKLDDEPDPMMIADPERVKDFVFIISTTKASPPKEIMKLMFPVRIE